LALHDVLAGDNRRGGAIAERATMQDGERCDHLARGVHFCERDFSLELSESVARAVVVLLDTHLRNLVDGRPVLFHVRSGVRGKLHHGAVGAKRGLGTGRDRRED
jgi:hypothetical protein